MTEPSAEVQTRRRALQASLLAWGRVGVVAGLLVTGPTWAQFAHVPMPLVAGALRASDAQTDQAYRREAALRIYESFPMHIYRGKMPALTYAIAITETDVRADGQVLAQSDAHQREAFLAHVAEHRAPRMAAHWAFVM